MKSIFIVLVVLCSCTNVFADELAHAIHGMRITVTRNKESNVVYENNTHTPLVYASTIKPLYLAATAKCLLENGKDYFTTHLEAANGKTLAQVAVPLLKVSSNEAFSTLRRIICREKGKNPDDKEFGADYVQAYLDGLNLTNNSTLLLYGRKARNYGQGVTPGFTSDLASLQEAYQYVLDPEHTAQTGLTPAIISKMLEDMAESYTNVPLWEIKKGLMNNPKILSISSKYGWWAEWESADNPGMAKRTGWKEEKNSFHLTNLTRINLKDGRVIDVAYFFALPYTGSGDPDQFCQRYLQKIHDTFVVKVIAETLAVIN